jgi:hypothetical protein
LLYNDTKHWFACQCLFSTTFCSDIPGAVLGPRRGPGAAPLRRAIGRGAPRPCPCRGPSPAPVPPPPAAAAFPRKFFLKNPLIAQCLYGTL